MDINSIVDNIKYGVASSNNGRVEIKDNSFLLNLLKEDDANQDRKESFSISKPWKGFKEHRFPITSFIFRTLIYILGAAVLLIYTAGRKLRCLLLGKGSDKDLSLSPRFNFVLFAGAIIFYIVAIVYIFIFFLKSVLLFNPNNSVNEQGAITIPQPCGVEHYIYLFNAAECWANTGIKVLEGDEISVTASGSFYSKISHMKECAENNDTLPYSRIIISGSMKSDESGDNDRELSMYKEEGSKFGSLLLQIKEEYEKTSYDSHDKQRRKIHQLEYENKAGFKPVIADSAGILYFAVNDFYFTEDIITKLKETNSLQKSNEIESVKYKADGVSVPFKNVNNDSIQRDMWFYDNVGEILLSITVTRNMISESESMPSCVVKPYRWMESKIMPLKKWELVGFLFLILMVIILWLGVDYFTGMSIKKHSEKE